MLKIDLEQTGYLGLPEHINCTGFKVNIDNNSNPTSIDFYYNIGVLGLNGQFIITNSYTKVYTYNDLRPLLNAQGQPVFEDVGLIDEFGEPILDPETGLQLVESQLVMISVIDFWLETLGNAYIMPDLLQTLTSIAPNYKK